MKSLFLIEYGCSCCSESLVVLAENENKATDYAYQEAIESWYSYECNGINSEDYPELNDEEALAEIEQEEMEQDIFYHATKYDPGNENHVEILREQDDRPFEI